MTQRSKPDDRRRALETKKGVILSGNEKAGAMTGSGCVTQDLGEVHPGSEIGFRTVSRFIACPLPASAPKGLTKIANESNPAQGELAKVSARRGRTDSSCSDCRLMAVAHKSASPEPRDPDRCCSRPVIPHIKCQSFTELPAHHNGNQLRATGKTADSVAEAE